MVARLVQTLDQTLVALSILLPSRIKLRLFYRSSFFCCLARAFDPYHHSTHNLKKLLTSCMCRVGGSNLFDLAGRFRVQSLGVGFRVKGLGFIV